MFWRKKKKIEVDEDALMAEIMYRIRGMFLDSQLEDAQALSVLVGASYVSPEVAEKEQRDSDARVQRIAHLLPLIAAQTYQIAEATTELFKTRMGEEGETAPEGYWEFYHDRSHAMTLAAVMGSIAQMVDLGLLSLGPVKPKGKL
jgi:hypothetical protein